MLWIEKLNLFVDRYNLCWILNKVLFCIYFTWWDVHLTLLHPLHNLPELRANFIYAGSNILILANASLTHSSVRYSAIHSHAFTTLNAAFWRSVLAFWLCDVRSGALFCSSLEVEGLPWELSASDTVWRELTVSITLSPVS